MAEGDSGNVNNNIVVFHSSHGSLVQLSENHLTAFRQRPSHEFNQGLVFSSKPLKDDQLFEVRIDRKVHSWTGSLQIGVTTHDPTALQPMPPNALDIVGEAWVLSGCNIFENGKIILEDYGPDLDDLNDGDKVGVMKTKEGDLVFCINSFAQGVAATGIPSVVYAVVDLYGKCVQATVMNQQNEANLLTHQPLTLHSTIMDSNQRWEDSSDISTPNLDILRFHQRCGSMVKLSANQRTAERRKPLDEFNNGVVMTQRPLLPDELFEIRIENLVDKWSGSIEVGITTHNPSTLDFPSTMTNLRSGTIMMSGCGILTNGKGTRREYGQCNLDELSEGDRIGLIRKSNGDLHFYVNSRDQGIAASNVPQPVWGVVDLYGRTVKVSLVERDEVDSCSVDQLLFHPRCGHHAAVVNGGTTAHRPNAQSDFNHGVVLTARPLRPDEVFEVRLDKIVHKWAGSIEIGVTTHRPEELDFPATMTNIRSGTWMMTGNGVMHNGVTILDDYGRSLDRLGSNDRVGVVRRSNGVLHFYVNGEDQGPAAGHIPQSVYGVVDLYGQAAQVSIVDHSPCTPPTDSSPYTSYLYSAPPNGAPLISPTSIADSTYALPSSSSSSTLHRRVPSPLVTYTDLAFHPLHGRNAILSNNGLTASRPTALSEFNDAIVMTSRPLRSGEMFEVIVEKLVERWSGSLELGVTAIQPENLDFPSTMTDIDYETWMLSGSSVMQVCSDGTIIRNGYQLDLDALTEGSRVGLLRHADGTLHYYLDGEDQGVACSNIPQEVYAVIDLYGQCAQVSLVHRPLQPAGIPEGMNSADVVHSFSAASLTSGIHPQPFHCLLSRCGKGITLTHCLRSASRDEKDFENGLIFSSSPLLPDEPFEIKIEEVASSWSGSLAIGLTTHVPHDGTEIPPCIASMEDVWYLQGTDVFHNGKVIKANFSPNLERLSVGDTISVRKSSDSTMRVSINGNDLGIAAKVIPQVAHAVVDLYGIVQSVRVTSPARLSPFSAPESLASPIAATATAVVGVTQSSAAVASAIPLSLSQLALREAMQGINAALSSRFGNAFNNRFHDNHGRNVVLSNNGLSACRTASYNQGVLFSKDPLVSGSCFQVKIDQIDTRWTGSIMIGVTGQRPEKTSSPMNALSMKRYTWIVCGNSLHHGGHKIRNDLSFTLNNLQVGQYVGVYISDSGWMHVLIDGQDQGPLVPVGTYTFYAVIDLYGQCLEVSTVAGRLGAQQVVEEKANLEIATTEKSGDIQSSVASRSCRYRQSCSRFIALMGLPETYLDMEHSYCCCDSCFSPGLSSDRTKMDPSFKGWCRFAVKIKRSNVSNEGGSNEKWQLAFHGTRAAVVRRILDEGHLLPPDLSIWQRSRAARGSKDHDGDSEGCQLLFSPSLKPAASNSAAPVCEFLDPLLKKSLRGKIVLQILVQPGSYKVRRASSPMCSAAPAAGPSTTAQSQVLNNASATEEAILWYTKERGAAIVQALLVYVDESVV